MLKGWLAAVIGALLLALMAFGGWLLVLDQPQKSDVILVLAGETDRWPARGLQLLDQSLAPRMILDVQANENDKMYQWTDLQLAQKYVNELPRSKDISVCPILGFSVRDEARDAIPCLQTVNARTVLVVTGDYHTRCALYIFRREMPSESFSVAPVYDPNAFGIRWWRHREWAKTTVREWARFLWYEVLDRWRS